MSVTTTTARDEISARFYDDWRSKSHLACGGTVPKVLWQALESDSDTPRTDSPWARVTISHNAAPQRTFGAAGERRFERLGIVTIQIFVPTSIEQGMTLSETLAVIARDAYEGQSTPSGVWFRNATIREVGPDGPWYQTNVVAEFIYEELK